ncbi:MAG: DUF4405 domain-containing protein [Sulfuricurvum sp.]
MIRYTKRDVATSFTAVAFTIIAVTGVMMYFHLLDAYTKKLHENLGLFFVAAALLHMYANWGGMKNYFRKSLFHIAIALGTVVSLGFILTAETGKNPKNYVINSVLNAPIESSFVLFDKDTQKLRAKLDKAGIVIGNSASINDMAKANHTSPFKIITIIEK